MGWIVNKAFATTILLEVNTVRVKTQLVVLTEKKCCLLQADFRHVHNAT